jgi:hypothetical protein
MSVFIRSVAILFLLIILLYGSGLDKNLTFPEYEITIKNNRFFPELTEIPPDTRAKLTIKNLDNNVEEFESFDLKREVIIPANGQIKMLIGPLKVGKYRYFGEFHEETARGVIEVK